MKIINFMEQADWVEPWNSSKIQQGNGTGFVIEGNRIMTNAHVVSWSKQLVVYRYQDPKPYFAQIEFVGNDCDLAVLKVKDASFFKGLRPLQIGQLPKVRSTVTTYGYPVGGQQISYTKGVISRIEEQRYILPDNRHLLAIQTDAAINPGNSGGPVIQDDRVVGVSFQGISNLENAGFFIPPNVIKHFLKDIEDGTYHGFPGAGLRGLKLNNPAFRKALGLSNNSIGCRVDFISAHFPKTRELIKENDVILEVSGYKVGSDGTILYQGNQVLFSVLLKNLQHGERIDLKVWRDGNVLDIKLPLFFNSKDRNTGNQYTIPPYIIVGGLVFTEFSKNYIEAAYNNGKRFSWANHTEAIYALYYSDRQDDEVAARTIPIVLSKILKHPTNIDFGVGIHSVLSEVNGQPIHSMQDLKTALEREGDTFHRFRFRSGREEALNRFDAQAANAELLEQYNIPSAQKLELSND